MVWFHGGAFVFGSGSQPEFSGVNFARQGVILITMTADAFKKATHSKNKELFQIDGATHIQTYWKPEYESQAVNKLKDFYQLNL
jgi:fermentation-respiration switch protein FrsA (DUF1100 family)